jgi:hypothetical protein
LVFNPRQVQGEAAIANQLAIRGKYPRAHGLEIFVYPWLIDKFRKQVIFFATFRTDHFEFHHLDGFGSSWQRRPLLNLGSVPEKLPLLRGEYLENGGGFKEELADHLDAVDYIPERGIIVDSPNL